MLLVEPLLTASGPTCADDANSVFITLGPDHEHESALDRADGDEPVLEIGMVLVEDLEIVDAGREKYTRLLNETPWFFWFARFLASSHVTFTEPV